MKLLFLASTDSYNFALPPLIKEARKRGHIVDVFCSETAYEHTRMFIQNGINFEPFKKIPDIKQYDVAIYQALQNPAVLKQFKKAKIPRFSMVYHLVNPHYVFGEGFSNAHITFCFGDQFKQWQEANGVKHTLIPIGSPQYDGLHKLSQNIQVTPTILIIETHYYPAHPEGKAQYAEVILKTARKNPDYKFVVKPRTVPSQITEAKHKAEHLYDYIDKVSEGSLPSNLTLLTEHKDLNQLIADARVVVSTWSTAIIPAMLLQKPILVLSGFKHLDLEYWNNKAVESFYDYLKGLGGVIHFSELPDKIESAKPAPKEFVDNLYYKFDGRASSKILDFIERVVDLGAGNDLSLVDTFEDWNDYLIKLECATSKQNINNNLGEINYIYNCMLDQYYLPNLRSGYLLDDSYRRFQNEINTLRVRAISSDDPPNIFKNRLKKIFEDSIKKDTDAVLDSNKPLLPGFKGWLISFWFERGEYERILQLPDDFQIADYFYFVGRIYEKQGMRREAIESLNKFIKMCHDTTYVISPALNTYFRKDAEQRLNYTVRGRFRRMIIQSIGLIKQKIQKSLWNM
jgi:tetratricopeptide (TPR) repeat protein